MLNLQQDISLDQLNTFGMKATAPYFSILTDAVDCETIISLAPHNLPILILGGGSNMLFTKPLENWIIKNEIKGIDILSETEDEVELRVGAGEVWHGLVKYCIDKDYGGIENLALIPGTVGAAPIQNIGAYGAEVKNILQKVHYWHLEDQKFVEVETEFCEFGYRDSIFKRQLKGKVIITAVDIKLSKKPQINISYGNIKEELAEWGIINPTIKDVASAVVAIRSTKLPDPKLVGNAGSFFKNPEISNAQFADLRTKYATISGYAVGETKTKVPAAWLIEQCGWKGFRDGDAGVHPKQPLVLVNYGTATGKEIYTLSEKVISSVLEKFGIELEREVQIL